MDLFLIIIIFMAAAAVVVLTAKNIASHKFKCRHCSGEFSLQWSRVIITEHSGSEYRLVCPFCKAKDWCDELPKKPVKEDTDR